MSTKIEYFGDFISSIIISEDKFKYLENAGVEILSCKEHDGKQISGEKLFDITFKVNNITFLNFMHAGIKYSLDKYCKH